MVYKLAIVDDEPLIQESIKQSIQWDELKCNVVLTASEVMSVFQYLENNELDIILLDINMPEMDGLTFAEKIKDMGYDIKIIIISAYQDFTHVKSAFRLGVVDYIAKPIRNEEIISIIKKTVEVIDKEKEAEQLQLLREQERQMLDDYFKQSKQLVQNNLLTSFIKGNGGNNDLEKIIEVIPKNTKGFSAIVIKQLCKLEHTVINKKYILDYFNKTNKHNNYSIRTTVIDDNVVLIVFFTKKLKEYSTREILKNICHSFLDYIRNWEYVYVYIGVSSYYSKIDQLSQSYMNALHVAENQFFTSKDKISFEDGSKNDRYYKFSIIHDLDSFYNILEECSDSNSTDRVKEKLSQLFNEISKYCNNNVDLARSLITEVCITIVRFYVSKNDKMQDGFSVSNIIEDIDMIENMDKAENYVFDVLKRLTEKDNNDYSPIIQSAIVYIKQNYNKNISLDILSNHLCINPSYLSRLMKKETNKNFSEIVLDTRLSASKKLLRDPKLRLNEIAVLVGYKDYAYFYQVFKKSIGITPMDYRKNNKVI